MHARDRAGALSARRAGGAFEEHVVAWPATARFTSGDAVVFTRIRTVIVTVAPTSIVPS